MILSSPNNPFADANGDITISKGNHLLAIPRNRSNLSLDYAVTDHWKIDADALFAGG